MSYFKCNGMCLFSWYSDREQLLPVGGRADSVLTLLVMDFSYGHVQCKALGMASLCPYTAHFIFSPLQLPQTMFACFASLFRYGKQAALLLVPYNWLSTSSNLDVSTNILVRGSPIFCGSVANVSSLDHYNSVLPWKNVELQ